MGFFAFLRVGEMTTACGREGSNHAIKIENVEVTNHNIKIYLASSKTDQLGRGISIFGDSTIRCWNLSGKITARIFKDSTSN